MSTTIRPELSKKNVCWLDKHRFYELQHFCLQYRRWKTASSYLEGMSRMSTDIKTSETNVHSNPTEKCALANMSYKENIKMVEKAAKETDEILANYILKAVTEGLSYNCLKTKHNIPCCKDTYYKLYRRFFWILSKLRN